MLTRGCWERLVGDPERDEKIAFAFDGHGRVTDDDSSEGFEDASFGIKTARWNGDFWCMDSRNVEAISSSKKPGPNASAVVSEVVYEGVGWRGWREDSMQRLKTWAAMALANRVAYTSEPLIISLPEPVRGKTTSGIAGVRYRKA